MESARRLRAVEFASLAVFLILATVAAIVIMPRDASSASGPGWVGTPTGPLGPADRDLLVKVRQAGLWEIPAGMLARERSADNKVKEVGRHLIEDHVKLDAKVRAVAAQLGVGLPNEANEDQRAWLAEMSGQTGAEFDRTFVNRLRAAHGKVFSTIAAVRAGTRNATVRSFAQHANQVVMRHITLLESTGLVDYDELPLPPDP